jgi:hypothetical protein
MIKASTPFVHQLGVLIMVVREETLVAGDEVETSITHIRQVPLLAVSRIVPPFPKGGADRASSGNATRTCADEDHPMMLNKRRHQGIESTRMHVIAKVKRIPHVDVDTISILQTSRKCARSHLTQLNGLYVRHA